MTRDDKVAKVRNKFGAIKAFGLDKFEKEVHQDYQVIECDGVLSDTGRLRILEFVRRDGQPPSFSARWDIKDDALDIDIHGVAPPVHTSFKEGKDGYSGHWTEKATTTNAGPRAFAIKIETPDGLVFAGTAWFWFNHDHDLTRKIEVMDIIEATVVRGGD